jgi:hypothetical protein
MRLHQHPSQWDRHLAGLTGGTPVLLIRLPGLRSGVRILDSGFRSE